MRAPLTDLFLRAVAVNAPSLHEQSMAEFVRRELADAPVRVIEDHAAAAIGGTSGNLICIPPQWREGTPSIALFAHLDTPRPTHGVKPELLADRITSDGTTILGVDNRAGVSVLLDLLRRSGAATSGRSFVVIFTVAEELGMLGAKQLDLQGLGITEGYVFDCSKRPGVFIGSAVGCSLYTATFRGVPSHAGVAPEKGRSAILMAAEALAGIPQGRLSPTMTTNVGTIQGGSATNVVPDLCRLEGEVRGFDAAAIERHLAELERKFGAVSLARGGRLEFNTVVDFVPFTLDPGSEVVRTTTQALRHLGLHPEPIEYLGGSDANALNAMGIPTVNIGIGAQNPHANDEFILLEDLAMSARMARTIVTGVA